MSFTRQFDRGTVHEVKQETSGYSAHQWTAYMNMDPWSRVAPTPDIMSRPGTLCLVIYETGSRHSHYMQVMNEDGELCWITKAAFGGAT